MIFSRELLCKYNGKYNVSKFLSFWSKLMFSLESMSVNSRYFDKQKNVDFDGYTDEGMMMV